MLELVAIKPRIAVEGIILNHPGDDGLACCKRWGVGTTCGGGLSSSIDNYSIRIVIDATATARPRYKPPREKLDCSDCVAAGTIDQLRPQLCEL
jgi:acetaldehyde dehydrogenase (acetylating)